MLQVPIGVGPPLTFAVAVPQPVLMQVDYTTATGVSYDVELPNGVHVTWAASIITQTTNRLTLYSMHPFVVTDVPLPGTYWIAPIVTFPLGPIRGDEFPLIAVMPDKLGLPFPCVAPVRVWTP